MNSEGHICSGRENDDEKLCKSFLIRLGYSESDIEEKPFGDRFPDFRIVSEDIGVEARRLNKYTSALGKFTNIESVDTPIRQALQKIVDRHQVNGNPRSWYIDVAFYGYAAMEFTKGKQKKLRLRASVVNALEDILSAVDTISDDFRCEKLVYDESGNVIVKMLFLPANALSGVKFILLPPNLDISAGWVAEELLSAVDVALRQKRMTFANSISKCATHWLVLIDYVNYACPNIDVAGLIDDSLKVKWGKIFIVNPIDVGEYNCLV
jgi:hypothetical protein